MIIWHQTLFLAFLTTHDPIKMSCYPFLCINPQPISLAHYKTFPIILRRKYNLDFVIRHIKFDVQFNRMNKKLYLALNEHTLLIGGTSY